MTLAVLIMAGGSGTRLWPISRPGRAKQFAQVIGGSTLIEQTYARARACLPDAVIFVSVTAGNEPLVRDLIPELPSAHLISAPEDRDTLPTLGFATLMIERLLPSPTLVLLAADNWIDDAASLRPALQEATDAARRGSYLVSIGIRPSMPSTQYGYMHLGPKAPFGACSYLGLGYVEKPDVPTATRLVEGGSHDWNSGMFAWTAATFWQAVHAHAPDSAALFEQLRDAACPAQIRSTYAQLPRLAVDKGVLEHVGPHTAHQHVFVRAEVGWNDIGHFAALDDHLHKDERNNRIRGAVTADGCHDCTLICDDSAALQVEHLDSLIVVGDSGDLLVANRESYARVRELAGASLWNGVSTPGARNVFAGFVKSLGSERCRVDSDSDGIVALLDIADLEVHIRQGSARLFRRNPAASPDASHTLAAARRLPKTMHLEVSEDERRMSELAAEKVVDTIKRLLAQKPHPLVMFSAGRTPLGLFALLRSRYREALDWSRVRIAQMDEFCDVGEPHTFASVLRAELAEPLGVREFRAIDSAWTEADLVLYESAVAEDGLDLVVHGIGCNGHLAFNEPGSAFDGRARIVTLAEITRQRAAASFESPAHVPRTGLTLGLKTLNSASEVVLMAASQDKSAALAGTLFGEPTAMVPASSLQAHPDVWVYADRFAATSWLREQRG